MCAEVTDFIKRPDCKKSPHVAFLVIMGVNGDGPLIGPPYKRGGLYLGLCIREGVFDIAHTLGRGAFNPLTAGVLFFQSGYGIYSNSFGKE